MSEEKRAIIMTKYQWEFFIGGIRTMTKRTYPGMDVNNIKTLCGTHIDWEDMKLVLPFAKHWDIVACEEDEDE